ncbi:MAG: Holliday junction resolvase RuvX [Candidatus Bathyarchaeota archaeon]|nr:Holliday junction resolvase RuvX [Candidatus Bathyarchaeota archaeon]
MTSQIAVVVSDGRLYYRLVEELKDRGLSFIAKKPGEKIPLTVKVVLTTKDLEKYVKHHTIVTVDEENIDESLAKALKIVKGVKVEKCEKLIVGIDPGKNVGFAVIADGVIVLTENFKSFHEAYEALKNVSEIYSPKNIIVKIGRGSLPKDSLHNKVDDVLNFVKNVSSSFTPKIKVLFVDENRTTKKVKKLRVKRGEKDKNSAVEIAFR